MASWKWGVNTPTVLNFTLLDFEDRVVPTNNSPKSTISKAGIFLLVRICCLVVCNGTPQASKSYMLVGSHGPCPSCICCGSRHSWLSSVKNKQTDQKNPKTLPDVCKSFYLSTCTTLRGCPGNLSVRGSEGWSVKILKQKGSEHQKKKKSQTLGHSWDFDNESKWRKNDTKKKFFSCVFPFTKRGGAGAQGRS